MSGIAQSYNQYAEGDHQCLMNILMRRYNKSIGDSFEGMIEFLKYIPEHVILDFSSEIENLPKDKLEFEVESTPNVVWWPIIEGKNAIEPFLQVDPGVMLENKKIFNTTSYFTYTNRVCHLNIFLKENFSKNHKIFYFQRKWQVMFPQIMQILM